MAELVSVGLALMIGRGWNAACVGMIKYQAEQEHGGDTAVTLQISQMRSDVQSNTWAYACISTVVAVVLTGW